MSFLGAQNSIALGVQGLIHIDTGGGAGGSADYLLNKSLRFRSSASAYLNRTNVAAPTNNKIFTYSAWVKRGTLGAEQDILNGPSGANGNYVAQIYFSSGDTLVLAEGTLGAGNSGTFTTTQLFRDPAAWYHIVITENSTLASNGLALYVNGVAVSSFSVYTTPTQNVASQFNTASVAQFIGRFANSAVNLFDGEMAEINFVDGQALAPTAFGAFSTYNQWLPIRYAGTYGTNGFYLPFTNTTSTSTLVADSSGNANNWTPNNISLTAGSTYDSLTDVPTLTSETVANYAVLNPLDKDTARGTISDANLKFAATAFSTYNAEACRATMGVTTGKWYYEFRGVTQAGIGNAAIANLTTSTQNLTAVSSFGGTLTNYIGASASISGNALQFQSSGYSASLANSTLFASYASGDVVNIAVDFTAGKIWIGKNGTWYNSGDPGAGTNATSTFTAPAGYNLPEFEVTTSSDNSNQSSLTVNFGQQPFVYTAPTGFLPLNTFNI
jgi:hypothetical protein